MSKSFIASIVLKQKTPIIHFQYDEQGASLRATEVKPKLDRYIRVRYLREEGSPIPEEWKLGDTNALNYRITINCPESEIVDLGSKDYRIFYGNTGREKKIMGLFAKAPINMRIVCMIPELLKTIVNYVQGFFISHNFGTMQRKGFGSYIVGMTGESEIAKELMTSHGADMCYRFKAGGKPFERIKLVYSIMKSGINFGGYRRSLLFLYMHEKGIGNEKAWLKHNGMAPKNVGMHKADERDWQREAVSNHEAHYVRALLGTGEKLEFLLDLKSRKNKAIVKMQHIPQNDQKIERLKSPIFFKVINDWVYFVGDPINKKILGQSFEFSSDYNGRRTDTLTVPQEFDLADFLEYCFRQLNTDELPEGFMPLTGFWDCSDLRIERFNGGEWK